MNNPFHLTDLDLLRLHLDALFVHDANGKLLRINELDPEHPAPRFFLSRSLSGNLWRTRYDLPAELAAELERLAAAEPVVGDLSQPPLHAAAYTQLLEKHATIQSSESGLAYRLPELDPPRDAVMITAENLSLLQPHYPYLHDHLSDYGPVAVTVADGKAVTACFSSRLTPQVGEAGLYTEAPYRRRGYAPDTVRGWAAGIRTLDKLPLYSTSQTNIASQAVARKLGAVQYGADFSIT